MKNANPLSGLRRRTFFELARRQGWVATPNLFRWALQAAGASAVIGLLSLSTAFADDATDAADAAKVAADAAVEKAGETPDTVTVKPTPERPPRVKVVRTGDPAPTTDPADKRLRLNFRGVALDLVLNYLSDAAGFIIVLETEIKGKVDVWSNQPVSQDEALAILNSALNKNGYAAIRNERTLTIVSKEEAKKRDIPVKSGSNPADIPKNEEIVTQIIPVRFINATQLTKDLTPLLPSQATMTANESGNALVITDTQSSIRRLAEIVKALDTSLSSVAGIRVFMLRYADAKELATVIKDLFPATDNNRAGGGGGTVNRFRGAGGPGGFGGFGGFGGGGGAGGGGGQASDSGSGTSRATASRVVAVADERSNSLIVNAPDDVIPTIEELVRSVDTSVEDVTELRVFRLQYADPVEMSEVLMDLFPDDSKTQDNNRGQVRFGGGGAGGFGGFGGFGGGGGGQRGANTAQTSDRLKKQGRVIAVADQRTSSVIVSAARELMGQIGQMISQLDSNPAKKQKVFVYTLENADVQGVEEILRNMFEGQNSRNNRTTSSQSPNALQNRQNQNNTQGSSTGFGSSGRNTSGSGQSIR